MKVSRRWNAANSAARPLPAPTLPRSIASMVRLAPPKSAPRDTATPCRSTTRPTAPP
jgi:hypothetical protein